MTIDQKIAIAAKMATVAFFANKSPLEVSAITFSNLNFSPVSGQGSSNDRFIEAVKHEVKAYIEMANREVKKKVTAVVEVAVKISDKAPGSDLDSHNSGVQRSGSLDASVPSPSPSPSPSGSVHSRPPLNSTPATASLGDRTQVNHANGISTVPRQHQCNSNSATRNSYS